MRAGTSKVGGAVRLERVLGRGSQQRDTYSIEMTLFEAKLIDPEPRLAATGEESGITFYTAWRWGVPGDLVASAREGSLCSRLLLEAQGAP